MCAHTYTHTHGGRVKNFACVCIVHTYTYIHTYINPKLAISFFFSLLFFPEKKVLLNKRRYIVWHANESKSKSKFQIALSYSFAGGIYTKIRLLLIFVVLSLSANG